MADLVAPEIREWLLEELRELIGRCGAETFLTAPILEPTPRDFPDPFEPTQQGVRVLLQRILAGAGLRELGVELDTFSEPEEIRELDERGRAKAWDRKGAAAWYAGIRDGCCHFGVAEENIGRPEALVASLCHEVAHAWRAVHRVTVEDRDLEEQLTDLTTVYLGFGVLTTNGAYLYRVSHELTGGESTGSISVTRWSHSRAGCLPAEAMSFLLAAQVKARGLGWLARRRLVSKLETNQASYFRWAYPRLGEAAEVRRLLGIPVNGVQAA